MSQPPKATESIYLPRPSIHPALFAFGLAALFVGLFAWWPYSVIGGVIALLLADRLAAEESRGDRAGCRAASTPIRRRFR